MTNEKFDPNKVSVSINRIELKGMENGNLEHIERKFNDDLYVANILDAQQYDEPPTIKRLVCLAALYYDYHTETYDLLHTQHVKDELGRAKLIQHSTDATKFAVNLRNRLHGIYRGYEHEFNKHLTNFDRLDFYRIKHMYIHHHERGDFKFIEGDE